MCKVTTQPSCRIYSGHQYLGRHRGLIQLTEVLQIMIVLHVCSATIPQKTNVRKRSAHHRNSCKLKELSQSSSTGSGNSWYPMWISLNDKLGVLVNRLQLVVQIAYTQTETGTRDYELHVHACRKMKVNHASISHKLDEGFPGARQQRPHLPGRKSQDSKRLGTVSPPLLREHASLPGPTTRTFVTSCSLCRLTNTRQMTNGQLLQPPKCVHIA